MSGALYFEDTNVGDQLPPLSKLVTTEMLVRHAGTSRDFSRLHYEREWAKANNIWDGIIALGMVKATFAAQLLTDWAGPSALVRELTCFYRGPDKPGDTVTVRGQIVNKLERDGERLVEVDTQVVGTEERITTPGHGVVALPSRDHLEERPSLVPILSEEARAKRMGTFIAPPAFLAALDPLYRKTRAFSKPAPGAARRPGRGGWQRLGRVPLVCPHPAWGYCHRLRPVKRDLREDEQEREADVPGARG